MKTIKSFNQIVEDNNTSTINSTIKKLYEYVANGTSTGINKKTNELCSLLYDCLSLLIKDEFNEIYTKLNNKKDILLYYFQDDNDLTVFMLKIYNNINNKNKKGLFNNLNDIILKSIDNIL